MKLYNIIDKRLLKEQMRSEKRNRITVSFYKYHHLEDITVFRNQLYSNLNALHVLGRIYVAAEGINAQISVPEESFEGFKSYLDSTGFLTGIRLNTAVDDNGKSFFKLKILIRKKLVADGLDDTSFDVTKSGQHLDAASFNKLAEQPETIIVDMRNHYESEIGHFENAICPNVDTFREELPLVADMLKDKKDHKILMYCTGGVRCEKASAYLKHQGFSDVNQLHGGIIEYAKQVKEQNLPVKFKGKNFVFDERLGERIGNEIISKCHQCGAACDTHTNCANDDCHLLFIQCDDKIELEFLFKMVINFA